MHRMRRFFAMMGLLTAFATFGTSRASAGLLQPSNGPQKYPDIIANLGKGVSYTYDPTSQRGEFHLKNTAYVLVTGTSASDEFDIDPSSDGDRYQSLNVVLDKNGNFVDDAANDYELHGKVVADDGTVFDGLLLKGKPVAFSTLDTVETDGSHTTQFQADLKISGDGYLASYYGPDSYIHLIAETGNGFTGGWDQDFQIDKVSSNTHGPNVDPQPFPVPEPTTLVLLAASGLGLAYRNRKRMTS